MSLGPSRRGSLPGVVGPGAIALAVLLLGLLAPAAAEALEIRLDFRFDDSGFFERNPEARTRLDEAATFYERFEDALAPIAPRGSDTWTARAIDPATPQELMGVRDLVVPEDTLHVFVGAADLSLFGRVGLSAPGGFEVDGSPAFVDRVRARDQSGALADEPSDFGPWGGSISFDTQTDFFLGSHPSGLGSGEIDFLSVALHELGHVLGVGTSDVWSRWVETERSPFLGVTRARLRGPASEEAFGRPVPLAIGDPFSPDLGHFASTVSSVVPGGASQTPSYTPELGAGRRKVLTRLDYAALDDVGWEVVPVPEPGTLGFVLGGVLALNFYARPQWISTSSLSREAGDSSSRNRAGRSSAYWTV